MSDAKSAVFALSDDLDSFAFSDAALANELRVMADAAWTEITAPRSTDERAGSAMFEVGRLEKFINGALQAVIDTSFPLKKIISGGQTGVDRAALDAALDSGFPCGGWCPEGRMADDGRLPERYPLQELTGGGYRQRTIKNLTESDGTVVIYYRRPVGGTELTLLECIRRQKPYQLIDASVISTDLAANVLIEFVSNGAIQVLNFGGPGARRSDAAYGYTYDLVRSLIDRSRGEQKSR